MTKIRLHFLLGFLLIAFSLSACFSGADLRIGILMDSFERERWLKDRDLLLDKIEDLGGVPLLEVAESDPDLQFEQAKKMIDKGVKVIILVPVDGKKSAKIVDYAREKGTKVIAYDRMISDCDLDYYISFDNVKVGQLQAIYLSQRRQGNYVLLGGAMSDNNSFLFHEGQEKGIARPVASGRINVLKDEYLTAWSDELAYQKTKSWLDEMESTDTSLDAVLAATDALASGAIRALSEKNMDGYVMVSGQDADMNAIKNMVQGKQSMTVYKPIEALAYTAAIAAIRLAKGGDLKQATSIVNNGFKDVPSILLTPISVDINNMEYTLLADGYITLEQLKAFESDGPSRSINTEEDDFDDFEDEDDFEMDSDDANESSDSDPFDDLDWDDDDF